MRTFTRQGVQYTLDPKPRADNFETLDLMLALILLTTVLALASYATGGILL